MSNEITIKDADIFHSKPSSVFKGKFPNDWNLYKKDEDIIRVSYDPCHHNPDFKGEKGGVGKTVVKWIFSEEDNLKENLFESNFLLMHETVLEPNSSIGLHRHDDREEIYYLLDGQLKHVSVNSEDEEYITNMKPGDACLVKSDHRHYVIAGKNGAKIIAVCVKTK